jgi:hypothetical protein
MGWMHSVRRRLRPRRGGASDGPAMSVDAGQVRAHLASFASSRRGVEAYVEPPTNVTATTMVFIAYDGEWTRRAVPSRDTAWEFARSLGVPVYDVQQTGYPSRMREWNSRQRRG